MTVRSSWGCERTASALRRSPSQEQKSGSVVEISGIKAVRFPDKRLDIISRVVVERLLPYFVDRERNCPRIVIRDAKNPAAPLSLNDYLGKDEIGRAHV